MKDMDTDRADDKVFRDLARNFPYTQKMELCWNDKVHLTRACAALVTEARKDKKDFHTMAGKFLVGFSADFDSDSDEACELFWKLIHQDCEEESISFDNRFYNQSIFGHDVRTILKRLKLK